MKIGVIGSGSWGTAISSLLASKGYEVWLWSWQQSETQRLCKDRENKEYLPGVMLPDNIHFTSELASCASEADLVITAVPSHAIRETAKKLAPHISDGQLLLNISKGLEPHTLLRLSEVIGQQIPQAVIAVMSGPSHAEEVGRGVPTTNVVASADMQASMRVQDIFMHPDFRVYTGNDMLGVELGGALKNVIALAAGIAVGLGCGDNTNAALMTRGIAEIKRLGVKMGARAETFAGLSGIGDLIVTCMSQHSRNRRAGVLIGQGKSLEETLHEVHMVVEGVNTCAAANQLAHKYGVSMPITQCTYRVLYEGLPAKDAIRYLMERARRHESEEDILGR